MINKYTVFGSAKLAGRVQVQGAKNSAMKHVIIPLLTNGKFILRNIPEISSTKKIAEILRLQGAEVKWPTGNVVEIDTSKVEKPVEIMSDLFYHTSGGILLIPILVNRFGYCEIKGPRRTDTGGDKIGRSMVRVNERLKEMGIKHCVKNESVYYSLERKSPIKYKVPKKSFGVSVLATFTALMRRGKSEIVGPCSVAEFEDVINILQKMGARIKYMSDRLIVWGGKHLKGVVYENMHDRHDFITFLSAGLCTESEIEIENVDYQSMKLDCLEDFLYQAGIKVQFNKKTNRCFLRKNKLRGLKPVKIVAKEYPDFVTEWQVIMSPLLGLISGVSEVVEGYFTNRMRQWEELTKFGAKYRFIKHPDYPEEGGNPRCVRIFGGVRYKGAKVEAKNVRAGAAMLIAGLAGEGKTVIVDEGGNIDRGYENLDGRLRSLGANIKKEKK